ncbi:hypothetical protein [Rhodococcus koreensis]|uniref:hypothetical protein n=1 Tax=Rhodococcus koreensis TaxID=99653 RepID=UPI00366CA73E
MRVDGAAHDSGGGHDVVSLAGLFGRLALGIGALVVALVLPGRTVTPESGDRSSELAVTGQ